MDPHIGAPRKVGSAVITSPLLLLLLSQCECSIYTRDSGGHGHTLIWTENEG